MRVRQGMRYLAVIIPLVLCSAACSSADFTVSDLRTPTNDASDAISADDGVPHESSPAESSSDVAPPVDSGSTDVACSTFAHRNGLGQTWIDCRPLGTFDLEQAQRARLAWPFKGTTTVGVCSTTSNCVSAMSDTECAVWCFDGPLAGRVLKSANVCSCPREDGASWD